MKFLCEQCEQTFNSLEECQQHEANCNTMETFVCDKCGRKFKWAKNSVDTYLANNQCHYINLGRMGYGSNLDGCDVNFCLCDECLTSFIDSFIHKNKIYFSGANKRYEENEMY